MRRQSLKQPLGHPNVVVVALAAKLARIAWAVLRRGRDYDHQAPIA